MSIPHVRKFLILQVDCVDSLAMVSARHGRFSPQSFVRTSESDGGLYEALNNNITWMIHGTWHRTYKCFLSCTCVLLFVCFCFVFFSFILLDIQYCLGVSRRSCVGFVWTSNEYTWVFTMQQNASRGMFHFLVLEHFYRMCDKDVLYRQNLRGEPVYRIEYWSTANSGRYEYAPTVVEIHNNHYCSQHHSTSSKTSRLIIVEPPHN